MSEDVSYPTARQVLQQALVDLEEQGDIDREVKGVSLVLAVMRDPKNPNDVNLVQLHAYGAGPGPDNAPSAVAVRILGYAQKAIREAKVGVGRMFTGKNAGKLSLH